MGLDMYLTKKTYVGANYKHNEIRGNISLSKKDTPIPINFERVTGIDEQVGYWRKANHIHNWFVTNVQGGEDDCGDYEVEVEQLEALLKVCEEVLANKEKAGELLPTQSGFFFGSTEYDDGYFSDIEHTVDIIQKLLSELEDNSSWVTIQYQSSW